jgi:hypothetical protein
MAIVVAVAAAGCKFPYPANVSDDDANDGALDDARLLDAAVDARVDASVDAAIDGPPPPLAANFQAADLVIGQPNFDSGDPASLDARRLF